MTVKAEVTWGLENVTKDRGNNREHLKKIHGLQFRVDIILDDPKNPLPQNTFLISEA